MEPASRFIMHTALWGSLGLLAAATAVATQSDSPTRGVVAGEIRFPGCALPEDLQVCAREVGTQGIETCLALEGNHYELALQPGTYVVYARSESLGRKAYYDRAVVCGLLSKCGDHRPIPVTVSPGSKTEGIHPSDWFAPTPPSHPNA